MTSSPTALERLKAVLANAHKDYLYTAVMTDDLKAAVEAIEAATLFRARILAVHTHRDYESVWFVNQVHMGPYMGPNYNDELKSMECALDRLTLPTTDGEKK